MNDLNLFLEELSAIFKDKDLLYRIYETAAKEKYSFLYVDLCAPIEDMFFINFNRKIKIKDI